MRKPYCDTMSIPNLNHETVIPPVGSSTQVGEGHEGDLHNMDRAAGCILTATPPTASSPNAMRVPPKVGANAFSDVLALSLHPQMKEMGHSDNLVSLNHSNLHMCPIVDLNVSTGSAPLKGRKVAFRHL